MIVAAAGHVDHGKSSLVFALTGMRTDRLPEEQRRGMTIEAGYAHADLGGGLIADFVDLPGHERYLRHLLAGIAAADLALLVVAADDGPMPQTFEHLQALQLLGVRRIVPVLTKVDRVDAARLREAREALLALLRVEEASDAPVFEISAPAGIGVEPLRQHLADVARALPARNTDAGFRFAIDRAFTSAGAGLVVTGTLLSGSVQPGDELRAAPGGSAVRVRGLQRHGRPVPRAANSERCAINLAPVAGEKLEVERGDWLVSAALPAPTRRMDVSWQSAAATTDELPSVPPTGGGTRRHLHLHIGTAVRSARLIALGDSRYAQLLLDHPVSAQRGDRFLLRDPAVQRLVGGGIVLDAQAPERGRAKPERLADLDALALDDPAQALARLLRSHAEGVEWPAFARNWNLPADARASLVAALDTVEVAHGSGALRLLDRAAWQALQDSICATVRRWHTDHPASRGLADAALHAALKSAPGQNGSRGGEADAALRRAALRELQQRGALVRDGFVWRLPEHEAQLDEADATLLQRVREALEPCGLRPPPLSELLSLLDLPAADATAFLHRAAALGHLVQVAKNRFFLPETLVALADIARELAAASPDGRFEVIPFRDRSGIGRNLSIQVLEHFDRMRITRFALERRTMLERD